MIVLPELENESLALLSANKHCQRLFDLGRLPSYKRECTLKQFREMTHSLFIEECDNLINKIHN